MATLQWLLETEFAICSNCGDLIMRSIGYWKKLLQAVKVQLAQRDALCNTLFPVF